MTSLLITLWMNAGQCWSDQHDPGTFTRGPFAKPLVKAYETTSYVRVRAKRVLVGPTDQRKILQFLSTPTPDGRHP